MDIASLAMSLSEVSLANEVSTSVMKIAMDDGKELAGNMTEMVKDAVDPNLGNVIDARV